MRYRLRTLLILLALGPIFLAATYWAVKDWQRRAAEAAAREAGAKLIALELQRARAQVAAMAAVADATQPAEEPRADLDIPFDPNATPGFAPADP